MWLQPLKNLHRQLLLGDAGRWLAASAAAALLVLSLSGWALLLRRMGGWRRLYGPVPGSALQRLHAGIQPGRLVLAVAGPGLATLLHFTCGAHGLGLLFHLGQQLLGHAGQALAQSSHPMQTRLLAQGGLGASRRVGRVGQGGHARECKPVQG